MATVTNSSMKMFHSREKTEGNNGKDKKPGRFTQKNVGKG